MESTSASGQGGRQRRDERKQVSLRQRYRAATDLKYVDAQCLDLSAGGMFIRTERPPRIGTLMKFECEDGRGHAFDGVGVVAWRREIPGEGMPPGMGVRFVRLSERSTRVVATLVGVVPAESAQPADLVVPRVQRRATPVPPIPAAPRPLSAAAQGLIAAPTQPRAEIPQPPDPGPRRSLTPARPMRAIAHAPSELEPGAAPVAEGAASGAAALAGEEPAVTNPTASGPAELERDAAGSEAASAAPAAASSAASEAEAEAQLDAEQEAASETQDLAVDSVPPPLPRTHAARVVVLLSVALAGGVLWIALR